MHSTNKNNSLRQKIFILHNYEFKIDNKNTHVVLLLDYFFRFKNIIRY